MILVVTLAGLAIVIPVVTLAGLAVVIAAYLVADDAAGGFEAAAFVFDVAGGTRDRVVCETGVVALLLHLALVAVFVARSAGRYSTAECHLLASATQARVYFPRQGQP